MTDDGGFSRIEADRILRRAAALEGSEDRRVSVDELRAIAREAGFAPTAVDRAIDEARETHPREAPPPPVQRWGLLVTHLSTLRRIPVEIRSEELMRAVRLLQPYREDPARLSLEEGEVTWRDRKGLRFSVTSGVGAKEIRVFANRLTLRRRKWTRWVKAAADRLEELVRLVARETDGPDRLEAGSAPVEERAGGR